MDRATRLTPNESRANESRALTGLRGCGALLVVAHHYYLRTGADPSLGIDGLLRRGYLGVDLFFVLSGFVLCLAYGAWFDGSRPGGLRFFSVFLVRRIARLWPLHAAALLVILAVDHYGFQEDVTVHTVLANLTMTQAWGFSRSINVPTWSISTEFLAYLLFPALAALLLQTRLGPWLGMAAVLVLIGAILYFAPPHDQARRGLLDIYHNYTVLPAARCLAGVILGMLAWRAGQTRLQQAVSNGWTGPGALFIAVIFMLAGVNDLLIYMLLPVIVLGMHFGRGPTVQLFAQGPVHRLGLLSYAIYVVHYALLDEVPFGVAPGWATLARFIIGTLALALLAQWAIERPGRVLIRRLANQVPGAPLQRAAP